MGLIYADIELINGGDLEMVRRGHMDQDEVKRIHINALVDTGSIMMTINENIQELLQLPVVGKRTAELANGQRVECNIVSFLEIRFKNRTAFCSAMVLPDDSEPLLGAIPLEEMDVVIHPQRQELMVNPDSPDMALMKMKKFMTTLEPDESFLAA
jgi:clan AA aspartic protease